MPSEARPNDILRTLLPLELPWIVRAGVRVNYVIQEQEGQAARRDLPADELLEDQPTAQHDVLGVELLLWLEFLGELRQTQAKLR